MKFFILMILALSSLRARADEHELLCKRVANMPIPKEDQPSTEQSKALKKCDAEALFYGIGKPKDLAAARKCAFAQLENKEDEVFGGKAILMMIYANGQGVKKNIPLAERFACELQSAEAELEGRIEHLESLEESGKGELDLCDDITSGYMSGFCAGHAQRIGEISDAVKLVKITGKWSKAELQAFAKLQKASDEFTKARAENEIDLSGSSRAAFVIAEENIQKKDFLESLQKLESGNAPTYTGAEFENQDKTLNKLFAKIMAKKENKEEWGTVNSEDIQKTQRAWLKYRDSWVEFAGLKFKNYSRNSISCWFTKKRNHMLRSFAN